MAKGKVQINQASRDELAELPGIGPATAETLIKLRDERGGFKNVSELEQVPGIGAQTLESIRSQITVSSNGGAAARKSADTGAKTAEAGARTAETGAKTAETGAKAVEAGARTAAKNGEAAADKVVEVSRSAADTARGLGAAQSGAALRTVESGTEKADYAVRETAEAQQDLLQAARQAQEIWLGLVQEQMTANVQTAQRMVACRSPQELAQLQVDYLRSSMERLVHGSARVAGPAAHLAGTWWSPGRWQHMMMTR
ncbi:MAG: helix-hairpin-helix domain-containing protein [Geminicoccaceae bacterium]|nr:helix-hairpin-helix domain-containing protein [Geminicoccaceae bacterium]